MVSYTNEDLREKTKEELIAEVEKLRVSLENQQPIPKQTDEISYSSNQILGALDRAILCAIATDASGNILFCNQFFLDISGYKKEEVLGKHLYSILTPDLDATPDLFNSEQIVSHFEATLILGKSESLTIRFNTLVSKGEKGKVQVFTFVGEDITEQIRVTKALNETNQLLNDFFDSSNDIVFIFNSEGKMLFANKMFSEILGYFENEVFQLSFFELVELAQREELEQNIKACIVSKEVVNFEVVLLNKKGKRVELSGKIDCKQEENGDLVFWATFRNISHQVYVERAQKLYYQVARLIEQSKPLTELYYQFHLLLNDVIEIECFTILLKDQRSGKIKVAYHSPSKYGPNVKVQALAFAKDAIVLKRPMFLYQDYIELIANQRNIVIQHDEIPKVWLGVPLILESEIIGMITVQSYQSKKTYNKLHLELLNFISGQLANTILKVQTEKDINNQKARLEAVFESGSHLMWTIERDSRLTHLNHNFIQQVEEFLEFTPYEGDHLLPNMRNKDETYARKWAARYDRVFKGFPQQFEEQFIADNGIETWWEFYLSPIYEQGSKRVKEVAAVAHDITQKKTSELNVLESEERFRNIFESLQDVYFRVNTEGMITMITPSIFELIGLSHQEIVGRPISEFFPNRKKLRELIKELLDETYIKNFESEIYDVNQNLHHIISNFRMIFDEKGRPVQIEGVARDINTLKKTTEELREAKDIAEQSLEVKKRFLSNMSHEIRTPMNGIIGMIDLLSNSPLQKEQREHVSTIKKSSSTLLNILNDILDLSKIEAGKMELKKTPLLVRSTIEKLKALFIQQASSKGTKLLTEIEENVPEAILTDETRLLQVLSNLTSNAIKFTEDGTITISVSVLNQDSNGQFVIQFCIKDTGIGISQENLAILFQQFSQVENSYTKSHGGTGLGLSISKELARLMGGEIGVESELGEGSNFWFTISAVEAKAFEVTALNSDKVKSNMKRFANKSPKILVVDDNEVNLKVSGTILEMAGADLTFANSGKKAIELVQAQTFEIIFMDIQMPVMNGITATQEIKKVLLENTPPIIAMTAFSMKEEREDFLNAGMDDYISKPVDAEELIMKAAKWASAEVEESVIDVEEGEQINEESDGDVPLIDQEKVKSLQKHMDEEMVISFYDNFYNDTISIIEVLKEAVKNKDRQEILSQLHTLKGNAGTLGVERLHQIVAEVEAQLKKEEQGLQLSFEGICKEFDIFSNHYKTILG